MPYIHQLYFFCAVWSDLSSIWYVFEWTWSGKCLPNGPKSAEEYPSESTQDISNSKWLSTQAQFPSILIMMKPAIFFFSIRASKEMFGSIMCLLATHLANCQIGDTSHRPRPLIPSNKWLSTLILIITEPGIVYLEIRVCTRGFRGAKHGRK
jgi:hypothetical protein